MTGGLERLARRLQDLARARGEAAGRLAGARRAAEEGVQKQTEQWTQEREGRRRRLQEDFAREEARLRAEASRELTRLERAHAEAVARIEEALAQQIKRFDENAARKKERGQAELQKKFAPRYERFSPRTAEIAALREETQRQKQRVDELAAGLKLRLEEPGRSDAEPSGREAIAASLKAGLAKNERLLRDLPTELWFRFLRSSPLLPAGFSIVLVHGGALLAVWMKSPGAMAAASAVVASSLVVFLVGLGIFVSGLRKRARAVIGALLSSAVEHRTLVQAFEGAVEREAQLIADELLKKGMDLEAAVEAEARALEADARAAAESKQESLRKKHDATIEEVGQRRDQKLRQAEGRLAEEVNRTDAEQQEERRRWDLQCAAKVEATLAGIEEEPARLARETKEAIDEFRRTEEATRRDLQQRFPAWTDRLDLPSAFPNTVYVGDARVEPAALAPAGEVDLQGEGPLTVPMALSFPARGGLFLSASPEGRGRALDGLLSTVLRILGSFPPGKLEFILIDPVGLGQSFSALMNLADFDEALVGRRIWTEPAHIERKLSDLTEHIEKVIQKYLRNKYASIDEYNREVGPMAEAYRFLVVADFPAGFSDVALERLVSIFSSGARCGVYPLILHDRRQKLPSAVDPAHLRRTGLVVEADGGGLFVADGVVRRASLEIDPPPDPDALAALLQAVGRRCADARRVELPFEMVAPKDEELWSLSSERGLRVPVGRAGADRHQWLDLGRGTAQHALVAGKTGSGKSALFHVLVTNAALWYHPCELELYLVDFKKGVEFKVFASSGLPHARVVAIEGDRELGLSVLRRLDKELTRRGELYRKAGVQEFAGYRRAEGAERLPRTLLLIDEFQEFFVEEDAIAQEAALLLDRIVRQGRAFGVHVVLGSQTLGGSYTLARATLDQMAVRIALQCNEADSYLILSDDNAAARFLSRPGEAIYNDMGGQVEGNAPFQVVWLPEEVEERSLGRARERAEREKWEPPEPTIVFEGNAPAAIRNNRPLRERLAKPFQSGALQAWVGEANAIKGPTEVLFKGRGTSNLLIVGQQREAAFTVILSSVVSLAAACPPKKLRFVVLDGSPPELGTGRLFAELAGTIPQGLELVEYAHVPEAMETLDAEVTARAEGERPSEAPIVLIVYDLQRFRKLRQGDEFDLGVGEGAARSPDKCFVNVLAEGPAHRVHTIVWCDSLANLTRALNRKTLREFGARILFQMSGADSSELIDSPLAARLGLYRGLLFQEEEGTVEKFRPYAMPNAGWMEEVRRALGGR